MRKLLSMLCILALILSLGACAAPEEPAGTTAAPTAAAGVYDAYTPYDETVTLTTGTTVLGVGGLPRTTMRTTSLPATCKRPRMFR